MSPHLLNLAMTLIFLHISKSLSKPFPSYNDTNSSFTRDLTSRSGAWPKSSTCTIHLSSLTCTSFTTNPTPLSLASFTHSFTWTIPNDVSIRDAQLPTCQALAPGISTGSTVYIRLNECNLLPPSGDDTSTVTGDGSTGSDGVPDGPGGFDLIGAFEDQSCASEMVRLEGRRETTTVRRGSKSVEMSQRLRNVGCNQNDDGNDAGENNGSGFRVSLLRDLNIVSVVNSGGDRTYEKSGIDAKAKEAAYEYGSGVEVEQYACWDIGLVARSFIVAGYGQKVVMG